jgi:hypothetical protein
MANRLLRYSAAEASAVVTTYRGKVAEETGTVIQMDAHQLQRRQIVFDCTFRDFASAGRLARQSTQGWSFGS